MLRREQTPAGVQSPSNETTTAMATTSMMTASSSALQEKWEALERQLKEVCRAETLLAAHEKCCEARLVSAGQLIEGLTAETARWAEILQLHGTNDHRGSQEEETPQNEEREDLVLRLLSSAQGNILDDEELIEALTDLQTGRLQDRQQQPAPSPVIVFEEERFRKICVGLPKLNEALAIVEALKGDLLQLQPVLRDQRSSVGALRQTIEGELLRVRLVSKAASLIQDDGLGTKQMQHEGKMDHYPTAAAML